jgi:hypothetical protein
MLVQDFLIVSVRYFRPFLKTSDLVVDRAKENKEKFDVSKAQILYVAASLLIQVPLSLLSSGRA